MRRAILTVLPLVALLLAASVTAWAQGFNYDAYEPRTLAELIAKYDVKELEERKVADGSSSFGASFPSRVRVAYAGEQRKIPDERKQFINDWVKTHRLDPRIGELFESELKFIEDGKEFWLPVQKQVIPYFAEELKKGEPVDLYVVIAGGRKFKGKWDWLILVNEFVKVESQKPAGGV
jgi:hypothetical protein